MNDKEMVLETIKSIASQFAAKIKQGKYSDPIEMDFDKASMAIDDVNNLINTIARGITVFVKHGLTSEEESHLHANYQFIVTSSPTKTLFAFLPTPEIRALKKEFNGKDGRIFKDACDCCRGLFEKVFKCGGCKVQRYCGEACAKKAWSRGHKHLCKSIKDAKL